MNISSTLLLELVSSNDRELRRVDFLVDSPTRPDPCVLVERWKEFDKVRIVGSYQLLFALLHALESNSHITHFQIHLRHEPPEPNAIVSTLEKNKGITHLSVKAEYSLTGADSGRTAYPFFTHMSTLLNRLESLSLLCCMDQEICDCFFASLYTGDRTTLKTLCLDVVVQSQTSFDVRKSLTKKSQKNSCGIQTLKLVFSGPGGLLSLEEMISIAQDNFQITRLDLTAVRLTPESTDYLCRFLNENHSISKLTLYARGGYDPDVPWLFNRGLSHRQVKLTMLDLSVSCTKENVDALIIYLASNPILQKFRLWDYSYDEPEVGDLVTKLVQEGLGSVKRDLRDLRLVVPFTQKTLDALGNLLSSGAICKIEKIRLLAQTRSIRDNSLMFDLTLFAQGVSRVPTITTLKFVNFQVDDQGWAELTKVLQMHKGLSTLKMEGRGRILTKWSTRGLLGALVDNHRLQTLSLWFIPSDVSFPLEIGDGDDERGMNGVSYSSVALKIASILQRNRQCVKKQTALTGHFWLSCRGRASLL